MCLRTDANNALSELLNCCAHRHSTSSAVNQDVVEVLEARRLAYFGHVTRMSNARLPCILLYMDTYTANGVEEDQGRSGQTYSGGLCSYIGILFCVKPRNLHGTDPGGQSGCLNYSRQGIH